MSKDKLEALSKNHQDVLDELMYLFKNNEQQVMIWLTSDKAPLCDVSPLSLLDSRAGKEKVLDMIYRIKTGDFS